MPKVTVEKAKNFIKTVVEGWMLGDLRRITELEVIPNAVGNCNFPIALYTLSCMDFLGYLISPKDLDALGNTKERILGYIDQTFNNNDKEKLKPHEEYFVNVFRHGLSHEFFPKMGGVSRLQPEVIWSDKGYIILDADKLFEMFERSVENLYKIVEGEEVSKRIIARLRSKAEKNKKFKSLILDTLLIGKAPFTSAASTSTTTLFPEDEH